MRNYVFYFLGLAVVPCLAWELAGDIQYDHDPSTITEYDGKYYIYSTAENVNVIASSDLITWAWGSKPFKYTYGIPSYMQTWCEKSGGDASPWNIWAPDIIAMNNQYYLYYSRNCPYTMTGGTTNEQTIVGVATSSTLGNTDFADQGAVISRDFSAIHYRVIDPTLLFDQSGKLWMAVGSFGTSDAAGSANGGIRLFELNPSTGKLASESDNGTRLAGPWIEAPYLAYHEGYYYLFFNQGRCCDGLDATYYIRVGRSTSITGPYTDLDGVSLTNAGGSLFMGLDIFANYNNQSPSSPKANQGKIGRELGPGHVGLFRTHEDIEVFSYHYYDTQVSGRSTLGIRPLIWGANGWPRFGWDLVDGVYAIGGNNFLGVNSTSATAPVFSSWEGTNLQLWNLKRVAANQFSLTNVQTGKSLGITNGAVALGNYSASNASFHWKPRQRNDRRWDFVNVSTGGTLTTQSQWVTPAGLFYIKNQYSGMNATVANSNTSTQVTQASSATTDIQKWRFVPTSDGYTQVINVSTGLAMELTGTGTADNTKIVQNTVSSSNAQKWAFELLPDSSWRMINKATDKVIQMASNTLGAGAVQMKWLSTREQQWALTNIVQTNVDLSKDCAGVSDGVAYTDGCGRCVGGTTGLVACGSVFQAEDFCTVTEGAEETSHAGYLGEGYLNLDNVAGSSVKYAVNAATAGATTLYIRMANGGSSPREMSVSVNGNASMTNVTAPVGSWTTWETQETNITLSVGHNEIVFTSVSSDGAANLDLFAFSLTDVIVGNCDGFSRLENRSPITGSIQMHENNLVLPMGMASVGAEVRLFQMNGKLVTTYKTAKGQNLLTFKVPPGLYFVKVKARGYVSQLKNVIFY